MTKFIEVLIDGKIHAINLDNISMVKQIDISTLEIHLLTKGKGEQISFCIPFNYGQLRHILIQEGRLTDSPAINATK